MSTQNSLSGAALIWSLASLGGSGSGTGGSGTPGKDGTAWIVVNEPVTDGFSAPLGSKANDLVLDSSGEVFRVIDNGGTLVLESTGVSLTPEAQQQKSLYQLYLDLEPKKKLTEAQFHDAFLEALENEDFNLYEFYKESGGLKYTTEQDFINQFIKVMDLDLDALDIETDRIISKDGTVSVIAGNEGIEVDTKDFTTKASGNFTLEASEIIVGSTKDTVDGSTKIVNVIDPVNDLDAVNKRYVDGAIKEVTNSISDLTDKVNELEAKVDKNQEDILDLISQINTKVEVLEVKHDREIKEVNDRIDGLEAKNTELENKITNLETKHQEDVDNLQEQIDNLKNQIITFLNGYLKDELPKMVEEEVKKYLEENPIEGGCNCDMTNWPPDVIDGNVNPDNTSDTILVWDNGGATSSEFDYIMTDNSDPAIIESDDRIAFGGDSDPKDDKKDILTFEQWLEKLDKTNIYVGGNAEDKTQLENSYILYMGGNATGW